MLDSIFAGEYATNILVSLTTSILYPDLPEIASLKLCRLANDSGVFESCEFESAIF